MVNATSEPDQSPERPPPRPSRNPEESGGPGETGDPSGSGRAGGPGEREPGRRPVARTALGARPRDMVISFLLLLPLIGFFAVLGGSCSFSPFGPSVDQSALPTVDARPVLLDAARRLPFAVREPALPPNWRVNSVDQRPAPDGASAVRVGWLTPGGRYLRLVQTNAEEGALVIAETEGPPTEAAPVANGWVRYTGGNGEPALTRRSEGATWLITGSGTDAEFRTLADAVSSAPPLAGG